MQIINFKQENPQLTNSVVARHFSDLFRQKVTKNVVQGKTIVLSDVNYSSATLAKKEKYLDDPVSTCLDDEISNSSKEQKLTEAPSIKQFETILYLQITQLKSRSESFQSYSSKILFSVCDLE